MIAYISVCLIVFLIGFKLGVTYILKGLTLRTQQLYEESDYQNARMIERVLDRYKNTK